MTPATEMSSAPQWPDNDVFDWESVPAWTPELEAAYFELPEMQEARELQARWQENFDHGFRTARLGRRWALMRRARAVDRARSASANDTAPCEQRKCLGPATAPLSEHGDQPQVPSDGVVAGKVSDDPASQAGTSSTTAGNVVRPRRSSDDDGNDWHSVSSKPPEEYDPPRINIHGSVSTRAAKALPAFEDCPVFQRSGKLVQVVREPERGPEGVQATGRPRMRDLPRQLLTNVLNEWVDWYEVQRNKSGDVTVKASVPPAVVSTILDAGEWEHVRPLKGISHWPVMRPNGTFATGDGYDSQTQYLICNAPRLVPPGRPSRDDACAAADELLELISEFPIQKDAGRTAWLAGILTLLARPAIAGAVPCILFDAPTPGAGKSLLAQLIATIVTGSPASVRAAPGDSSEWHRALLSIALGGKPIILLDNLRGKVESGAFEAMLTSGTFSDRRLRTNEEVHSDVQTLFLLTANNATLTADLVRRSLYCRLVPREERPEQRGNFSREFPLRYVQEHRAQLLRCALTILAAYQAAGRPRVRMRPMGSFEVWSSVVRAALVWAGCADPAETQDALRESATSELHDASELFEAWYAALGNASVTVRDVRTRVVAASKDGTPENERLRRLGSALLALCDVDEPAKATPRVIGARLKPYRDRVLNGHRLESAGRSKHGEQWRVTRVG